MHKRVATTALRLHLYMPERHSTGYAGMQIEWAKINDRFAVFERADGGEIYVYHSQRTGLRSDRKNGPEVIAEGAIDHSKKEWLFSRPSEPMMCLMLLRRIVGDAPEVLRYYGDYFARGPHGGTFGLFRDLECN